MNRPIPFATMLSLLLTFLILADVGQASQFNFEIGRRIHDRLTAYMSLPKHAVDLMEKVNRNDYLNLIDYEDRDSFASLTFSLLREFNVDWSYYATEEGVLVAYTSANEAKYREPGEDYVVGADPATDKFYHGACVNAMTGEPETCTKKVGSQYISCVDDCSYKLCPDQETESCRDSTECALKQKWCQDYKILNVTEDDPPRGFIPRTDHCITDQGKFTEERGSVLKADGTLGSCFYADKTTRVERQDVVGDFGYCKKLKDRGALINSTDAVCSDTFVGGFRSRDFDHRWRPWYIRTKELQRPNWFVYTFFDVGDLGISYCLPFYKRDEATGRNLFDGVFAADYTFHNISNFLRSSYPNEDGVHVVIYETAQPNHMVAVSTGRHVAKMVLIDDETVPCQDSLASEVTEACKNIRASMGSLEHSNEPFDDVLFGAYSAQQEMGKTGELAASETDSQAYVSQSIDFVDGEDLQWTILIISEVERSTTDAVTPSHSLFAVVCLIAVLGFLACSIMFLFMFLKRKTRAVILADWRFTLAFLLGCALLNLSSLTFLGDNTEELCLARMWSFHLLFAVTMSPLLVKVYRMYRLVGSQEQSPTVISNPQAVVLTMPIVLLQVAILVTFTIVDPSVPVTTMTIDDSVITQTIECTQETNAFGITVLVFEAGILFIGCVLAFLTRNLAANIGQSKEMIFSIYNIAFVGLVTLVISYVTDIDAVGRAVFFSMGIFCGTVFSSAAFVLPRVYSEGESIFRSIPLTSGLRRSSKGTNNKGSDKSSPEGANSKPGSADEPTKGTIVAKRSGKSVSFLTEAPATGWSAMESSFATEEDEEANMGSHSKRSKRFSGEALSKGKSSSTFAQTAASGWSVIEEDESTTDDQPPRKINNQVSKRFSNTTGAGTIPRISGWSQFDSEVDNDTLVANDARASKEFSDEEEPSEAPSSDDEEVLELEVPVVEPWQWSEMEPDREGGEKPTMNGNHSVGQGSHNPASEIDQSAPDAPISNDTQASYNPTTPTAYGTTGDTVGQEKPLQSWSKHRDDTEGTAETASMNTTDDSFVDTRRFVRSS